MAPLRRTTLVVVTVFVAVNVLNLALWGIRSGGDTSIYTDAATAVLHGTALTPRAKAYVSYWALLAGLRAVGLPFGAVVAVQCFLAWLATVAAMSLGRAVGGERTALIAGLLIAANPELAKWNAYILTDSIYISLVVIVCWATWQAARKGGAYIAVAALTLTVIALQRPNGLPLFPVCAIFWISARVRGRATRLLACAAVIIAFVGGALALSGNALTGRQPDEMVARGEVIWNYPEGRLAMPEEPPAAHHGWGALLRYAAHHPVATTRLFVWRVIVELAHARPFYAAPHNVLAILLLPFYVLAIVGVRAARDTRLTALLLAVVAVHILMICISYADWDGRFLLHFWPLLAILAARGADVLLSTGRGRAAARWIDALHGA